MQASLKDAVFQRQQEVYQEDVPVLIQVFLGQAKEEAFENDSNLEEWKAVIEPGHDAYDAAVRVYETFSPQTLADWSDMSLEMDGDLFVIGLSEKD